MKRGEIYIIQRHDTVGHEIKKARPGVVVSNDALNATSPVVEVVYLTTQPKKDLPTHVTIRATGVVSTALCEHIDHVSTALVGKYLGECTEEEMRGIDVALLVSLGIDLTEEPPEAIPQNHDPVNHPSHYTSGRIETIDFIEDKGLGFHLGNAVKYITRAGKKDPAKTVEDLQKAIWYVKREIQRKEGEG